MDLPWSEVLEPTKTVVQVNLPFKILGSNLSERSPPRST